MLKLDSVAAFVASVEAGPISETARLPAYFIYNQLADAELMIADVDAEAEDATIYISYPEDRRGSAKIRALTESLRKAFVDPRHWDVAIHRTRRLRRLGCLPLTRKSRCCTEAREPHLTGHSVDEDIGRFDVLVNDAATMHTAKSGCEARAETEEQPDLHCPQRGAELRGCEESVQRLALLVLENQSRTPLMLCQSDRSNSPRRIEVGAQGQLTFQHADMIGARVLRGQNRYEN
jgi:hypothetical protein